MRRGSDARNVPDRKSRSRLRFCLASVAGVASHFHLAAESRVVDRMRHGEHLASHTFGGLVIRGEVILHVAVFAVDAEGCGDELHGGDYLVGGDAFESFDVFILLFGEFGFLGVSG